MENIFVVVLTGGIASGKTAVSDFFARRGVPIIDTDVIAHEIVEPGQPALQQIRNEFGQEFIDGDGRLDRRKMRNAIFSNPELKQKLEEILHPAISTEASRRIARLEEKWCILVVPLLVESGLFPWIDRVLVVDAKKSVQIERVMARDRINRQQAQSILDAQASRQQRLSLADDIIENNGTLTQLEAAVDQLFLKSTFRGSVCTCCPNRRGRVRCGRLCALP
jgi:dephospho-CoA kinase